MDEEQIETAAPWPPPAVSPRTFPEDPPTNQRLARPRGPLLGLDRLIQGWTDRLGDTQDYEISPGNHQVKFDHSRFWSSRTRSRRPTGRSCLADLRPRKAHDHHPRRPPQQLSTTRPGAPQSDPVTRSGDLGQGKRCTTGGSSLRYSSIVMCDCRMTNEASP